MSQERVRLFELAAQWTRDMITKNWGPEISFSVALFWACHLAMYCTSIALLYNGPKENFLIELNLFILINLLKLGLNSKQMSGSWTRKHHRDPETLGWGYCPVYCRYWTPLISEKVRNNRSNDDRIPQTGHALMPRKSCYTTGQTQFGESFQTYTIGISFSSWQTTMRKPGWLPGNHV